MLKKLLRSRGRFTFTQMFLMCVLGVGSGMYIWKPVFSEMSEVKEKQSKEES